MKAKMNICFDLGRDSLKVSYGYMLDNGSISYGKITEKSYVTQQAIPGNAFFDENTNSWHFGTDIDRLNSFSFANVVKIKDLLSLLMKTGDKRVDTLNADFYFKGHDFPKFHFPSKISLNNPNDFNERKVNQYTFECEDKTPQDVCYEFFVFVKSIMNTAMMNVKKAYSLDFEDYTISIIYPSKASKEYIAELKDLIERTFHREIALIVSSTKSLSIYAKELDKVSTNESFLVFDIGDEYISVSKAGLNANGDVMVDGVDGHLEPLNLGGNDIDEDINNYMEGKIEGKETIGTAKAGTAGHITETGLISKQYLLMKNIKKAKFILSSEYRNHPLFKDGVPININREALVQQYLTGLEMKKCIGMAGDNEKSAYRLYDYIKRELEKPLNREIEKIFISGGVIETYGLVDFIQSRLDEDLKRDKRVTVNTFKRTKSGKGELEILSYEDSLYAPAMGGNIIALKGIEIKQCLSLSYATYLTSNDPKFRGNKILKIFVDKGTEIASSGETRFVMNSAIFTSVNQELYSTVFTNRDLAIKKDANKLTYDALNKLVIYEDGSEGRRALSDIIGLNMVTGGKNATINITYKGEKISDVLSESGLFYSEGIKVDEEGHASPFITKNEPKERNIQIKKMDGSIITVPVSDCDIAYEGVSDFKVSGTD